MGEVFGLEDGGKVVEGGGARAAGGASGADGEVAEADKDQNDHGGDFEEFLTIYVGLVRGIGYEAA